MYEDQSGRKIPEEVLAATLSAGIENAAVSPHLALNASSLDTYVKIKEAVRTFVQESSPCGDWGPIAVSSCLAARSPERDLRAQLLSRLVFSLNEVEAVAALRPSLEAPTCGVQGRPLRSDVHGKGRV